MSNVKIENIKECTSKCDLSTSEGRNLCGCYNGNLEEKQKTILQYIQGIFAGHQKYFEFSAKLNDDSDKDWIAFEITISNTTNDKILRPILRVNNDYEYQMLVGEEFEPLTRQQVLAQLLFEEVCTLTEY